MIPWKPGNIAILALLSKADPTIPLPLCWYILLRLNKAMLAVYCPCCPYFLFFLFFSLALIILSHDKSTDMLKVV